MEETNNLVLYKGGCHCREVRFEVYAEKKLRVFKCNCSVCLMKQNHHFIAKDRQKSFKIVSGENFLSTYTFNTKKAQHKFCKECGVQPFYFPRSNPDGVAITIYCLDDYGSVDYKIIHFDGQNWEQEIISNNEIKD